MKNIYILLCIVSLLLTYAVASADTGKDLFEKNCGKCHTLERSLNKTSNLNAWKRTITRMVRYSERAGQIITNEDADKIAEYLAGRGQVKERCLILIKSGSNSS